MPVNGWLSSAPLTGLSTTRTKRQRPSVGLTAVAETPAPVPVMTP